jgi:hypothetical protein
MNDYTPYRSLWHRVVSNRAWDWLLVLCAVAALIVMLLPADTWQRPAVEYAADGFDPALVAVRPGSVYTAPAGLTRVSPDKLELTALAGTQATAELFTYSFAGPFNISFHVNIDVAPSGTKPMVVSLTNILQNHVLELVFNPAPDYTLTVWLTTPEGEQLNRTLGNYKPRLDYQVDLRRDTDAGEINIAVKPLSPSIAEAYSPALQIIGGPDDPQNYLETVSPTFSVTPGVEYEFGGYVQIASGNG